MAAPNSTLGSTVSRATARSPVLTDASQPPRPSLLGRKAAARTAAQSTADATTASIPSAAQEVLSAQHMPSSHARHSSTASTHSSGSAGKVAGASDAASRGQLETVLESSEEAEAQDMPQHLSGGHTRLAELAAVDSASAAGVSHSNVPDADGGRSSQLDPAPVRHSTVQSHTAAFQHTGPSLQAAPALHQLPGSVLDIRQDTRLQSAQQHHRAQQGDNPAVPGADTSHVPLQAPHYAVQQQSPARSSIVVSRHQHIAAHALPFAHQDDTATARSSATGEIQINSGVLQQLQASLAETVGASVQAAVAQMR